MNKKYAAFLAYPVYVCIDFICVTELISCGGVNLFLLKCKRMPREKAGWLIPLVDKRVGGR